MDAQVFVAKFMLLSVISGSFAAHIDENLGQGTSPNLFSKKWNATYTRKQLKLQSPWFLNEDQPDSGDYEVRSYLEQWKAVSNIPCLSQQEASSIGYMYLYFFFNGYNYQRRYYPLTYPVLMEIDLRDGSYPGISAPIPGVDSDKPPKKLDCPERYSNMFYVPISLQKYPATASDSSVTSIKQKAETFFVREFENSGNYTMEYCKEQKEKLLEILDENDATYIENLWYCASYDLAIGAKLPRREVWIKKKEE